MPITRNEYNERSKGGTELSMKELETMLGEEALAPFQIIPSRFRGLQPGLIPIYWVHDTENDPEMKHLENGGWAKFEIIVFVSNWQMQRFIERYDIPWSKCVVIPNAIMPFTQEPRTLDTTGTIRFIYHTTPHRGLNVLTAAFEELAKTEDVHLDVFSSFSIYGWDERDKHYEPLYDRLRRNPKVTYHGAKDNEVVREALLDTHFFVYPCTWPETGCRALIEAMMAGVLSSTTNYGCLYETGARIASSYQFHEDQAVLAGNTFQLMKSLVDYARPLSSESFNLIRDDIRTRATDAFSWNNRANEWRALLDGIKLRRGV